MKQEELWKMAIGVSTACYEDRHLHTLPHDCSSLLLLECNPRFYAKHASRVGSGAIFLGRRISPCATKLAAEVGASTWGPSQPNRTRKGHQTPRIRNDK